MPYVDDGPPKTPSKLPPILPIVSILIAMAVGVALFPLLYNFLNFNQWLAPLVAGLAVGLAMRLTNKGALPRPGTIAIVATLAACLVGYVVRHVAFIKWLDPTFTPTIGHAFEYLFSADMMSVLLIAMSAYIAFAIGAAMPSSHHNPPAQSDV